MKEEKHKIFIKDGEVVASGTESQITDNNIVASIDIVGVDADEVQEVDKQELKDINKALRDNKKKVVMDRGKPRIVDSK